MAVEGTTEDKLAWEKRQAQGAAIAALLAALLTFVGTVWRGLALSDLPRTGVAETIDLAAQPGPVGEAESLRVETFSFYQDNATSVVLSSVIVGLGFVALGWALTYLAVATRNRRPEMSKYILYLPLIAGVLQGVSTIVSAIATNIAITDFLDGGRTVDDALDITAGGVAVFAQVLSLPGVLGLALSLVFISLNAMRVGLLTRFMGVLGMIAGALQVLPLGGPLPVVQAFWLIMLAVLFLGRWPNGQPPAWRTGRAEPWPTSAELRAQRAEALARQRGDAPPEDDAEPVGATAAADPRPVKRKRKKR